MLGIPGLQSPARTVVLGQVQETNLTRHRVLKTPRVPYCIDDSALGMQGGGFSGGLLVTRGSLQVLVSSRGHTVHPVQ